MVFDRKTGDNFGRVYKHCQQPGSTDSSVEGFSSTDILKSKKPAVDVLASKSASSSLAI